MRVVAVKVGGDIVTAAVERTGKIGDVEAVVEVDIRRQLELETGRFGKAEQVLQIGLRGDQIVAVAIGDQVVGDVQRQPVGFPVAILHVVDTAQPDGPGIAVYIDLVDVIKRILQGEVDGVDPADQAADLARPADRSGGVGIDDRTLRLVADKAPDDIAAGRGLDRVIGRGIADGAMVIVADQSADLIIFPAGGDGTVVGDGDVRYRAAVEIADEAQGAVGRIDVKIVDGMALAVENGAAEIGEIEVQRVPEAEIAGQLEFQPGRFTEAQHVLEVGDRADLVIAVAVLGQIVADGQGQAVRRPVDVLGIVKTAGAHQMAAVDRDDVGVVERIVERAAAHHIAQQTADPVGAGDLACRIVIGQGAHVQFTHHAADIDIARDRAGRVGIAYRTVVIKTDQTADIATDTAIDRARRVGRADGTIAQIADQATHIATPAGAGRYGADRIAAGHRSSSHLADQAAGILRCRYGPARRRICNRSAPLFTDKAARCRNAVAQRNGPAGVGIADRAGIVADQTAGFTARAGDVTAVGDTVDGPGILAGKAAHDACAAYRRRGGGIADRPACVPAGHGADIGPALYGAAQDQVLDLAGASGEQADESVTRLVYGQVGDGVAKAVKNAVKIGSGR